MVPGRVDPTAPKGRSRPKLNRPPPPTSWAPSSEAEHAQPIPHSSSTLSVPPSAGKCSASSAGSGRWMTGAVFTHALPKCASRKVGLPLADRAATLRELLGRFDRIAITGAPRTGKSYLSAEVTDRPVIHTDDFIAEGWENAPAAIVEKSRKYGRFVIEGVSVPRALRGAKDGSKPGMTVDAIVWLDNAMAPQTPKQRALGDGVKTVFAGWIARHREVLVVYPDKFSG